MKARFLALAAGMLLAAGQAHAVTINIPGCPPENFSLVAKTAIQFENGPTDLTGNILVTGVDGLVKVGAQNQIHGTIIAKTIQVAVGAVIDKCVTDEILGPGTCTTVVPGGYTFAPAACKTLPFTPETVDPCVNTGLVVNVPNGATENLAPGCYGLVRVGIASKLNLTGGLYLFGALRVGIAGQIVGPVGPPRAHILTKLAPNLSVAAKLTHVDIFSAGTVGPFQIGNGITLTDFLAVAAASSIHIHAGTTFTDSAAAAERIVVEPVASGRGGEGGICVCPVGLDFVVPQADCGPACDLSRACESQ